MKKKFAFFFVFLFAFVFISCKDKKNGSNVASSENQSAASEIQGTKIEFAGFDKLCDLLFIIIRRLALGIYQA